MCWEINFKQTQLLKPKMLGDYRKEMHSFNISSFKYGKVEVHQIIDLICLLIQILFKNSFSQ